MLNVELAEPPVIILPEEIPSQDADDDGFAPFLGGGFASSGGFGGGGLGGGGVGGGGGGFGAGGGLGGWLGIAALAVGVAAIANEDNFNPGLASQVAP